ncbi:urease accessory protein UreF [Flexivirga sp. ID2601S]|uniref:Urease accessory protein UreF n=1 Tax=Flexivirga aerilata TaxID=1656889 RepID=A0A849AI13_9MICO|nr:urease accessory UreF family protein [Flexivirga aerilata]NNG38941.1 urease accessory protein UreF [Flexivirga aerilata]
MDVLASLLGDARLPTGGHTQSAGLEPALAAGLPVAEVPDYLAFRLRTVGLVDAGAAVVTRHRLLAGLPVQPVVDAWAARTPSHVAREAALATGRGYLRFLQRFWPYAAATAAMLDLATPVRPIALGAVAAAAGLDANALARSMSYDEAQTVTAATLKLEPLDPLDATGWVLAAQPEMDRLTAAVVDLTDPADLPAPAAPMLDEWCLDHARSDRRLFRA